MQNGNSNLKSLYWNTNGVIHQNETKPKGKETYDDWHDIDWQTVNKNVNRLRARIFRAAKQKDFKNLRNLQELMLNSSDNFLISIRKTTTAKGRLTSGIDNKLVITPTQRMELFRELTLEGIKTYMPVPVRRIHLIKADGSPRPLGIPTIRDRVIQNIVKNALEPEWETKFDPVSFGFRPARSLHDAVSYARHILSQKARPWVLEVDVAKCFDSIDHNYMLGKLKYFPALELIKRWLNAGILFNHAWLETLTGTPQGGVLSPLLCNLAMQGLPEELGLKIDKKTGKYLSSNKYAMCIYADDMVIFTRTKEDCEECLTLLDSKLAPRGLKLNKVKTKITSAYDGFDFLGFRIYIAKKYGTFHKKTYTVDQGVVVRHGPDKWFKAVVEPTQKSMTSIKQKLKTIFLVNKAQAPIKLITQINPIIRGWANNKRHWFYYPFAKKLDHYMYNLQIRWIKRRHPNKGAYVRNAKYFSFKIDHSKGIRHKWTFVDLKTSKPMLKFSWFYERTGKKKDWVKINGHMCIDDYSPQARAYFKQRAQSLFDNKLADLTSKLDQQIAKRQNLICPICKESLFNNEPLHRHHILERSKGGKDTPSNLCFVHQPCHYKLHYGTKKRELNKLLKSISSQPIELGINEPATDLLTPEMDGFTDGFNPVESL